MYIATVIPLAKGIQKEHLSYFTAEKIEPGMIVTVPVRKKFIDAIVIDIEPAEKPENVPWTSNFITEIS